MLCFLGWSRALAGRAVTILEPVYGCLEVALFVRDVGATVFMLTLFAEVATFRYESYELGLWAPFSMK